MCVCVCVCVCASEFLKLHHEIRTTPHNYFLLWDSLKMSIYDGILTHHFFNYWYNVFFGVFFFFFGTVAYRVSLASLSEFESVRPSSKDKTWSTYLFADTYSYSVKWSKHSSSVSVSYFIYFHVVHINFLHKIIDFVSIFNVVYNHSKKDANYWHHIINTIRVGFHFHLTYLKYECEKKSTVYSSVLKRCRSCIIHLFLRL